MCESQTCSDRGASDTSDAPRGSVKPGSGRGASYAVEALRGSATSGSDRGASDTSDALRGSGKSGSGRCASSTSDAPRGSADSCAIGSLLKRGQRYSSDAVWTALYGSFVAWRRKLQKQVEGSFNRGEPRPDAPHYHATNDLWWACMVYEKVSNLELVLSRKRSVKDNTPTDIGGVPVEEDVAPDAESDPGRGGEDRDAQEPDGDADDPHCEQQDQKLPNGEYPVVIDVLCGVPPLNVNLELFLGEPSNIHRRGMEAKYTTEYFRCAPNDSFDTANSQK